MPNKTKSTNKSIKQSNKRNNRGQSDNKRKQKRAAKLANKTPVQKEFDTFRHEIFKLGLTGLDKKTRVDARYELAIKLGAKPKKWIKPNSRLGEDSQAPLRKPTDFDKDGKAREIGKYPQINSPSST